jgi:hypothetical protein
MASAPDFDPNNPLEGAKEGWLNRMSNGTFEMGSTFKTFSLAMALDTGKVKLTDSFDATQPIRIGGFTIHDFHGQRRWLTLPEVFQYSSNVGTARIIDIVGHGSAEGLPDQARPADEDEDRASRSENAEPAESLEEDQLGDHLLRPRCLDHAAADGGRGCCAGQRRQADRADLPAAHAANRPTMSPRWSSRRPPATTCATCSS